MTRTENTILGCFPRGEKIEVLRSCNPNRNGVLGLVKGKDGYTVVIEYVYGSYDCEESDFDMRDFETLEEATSCYEGLVLDSSNSPNWDLQAEYDAAHDTINGEDRGIYEMRELWGV